MADNFEAFNEKIARIEAVLEGLAASTLSMADRLDILTQECQRTAVQVQRLGLNQEAAKLAGERRDRSLKALTDALAALTATLENRRN